MNKKSSNRRSTQCLNKAKGEFTKNPKEEKSEGVNFSAEENKRFWSGMKDLGRDREAGQLDEQRNEKNE